MKPRLLDLFSGAGGASDPENPWRCLDAVARWFALEIFANETTFRNGSEPPAELLPLVARYAVSEPLLGWPTYEDAIAYVEELYLPDSCPHCGCTDPSVRLRGIVLPVCPDCEASATPSSHKPPSGSDTE